MTALRARARTELVWGVADQAVSSGTNLGLSVLAGRLLGTTGLGVVFLGFSMYLLAFSLVRGLVTEPFVVATSALDKAEQEVATRACMTLVVAVGAVIAVVMVIAGLAIGDPLGRSLIVFAPWTGVAIVQDQWRSVLFRDKRGAAACFNDSVWALGMLAMLPVALTFQYDWVIAATWGTGAAAAALVGFWQVKLRPTGLLVAIAWWRRDLRYLGTWLAMENAVVSASGQLTIALLASQLGVGNLGGIRAVEVVFAPMTLVGEAFTFPGVPILAQALAISAAAARRWAWSLGASASLIVGAYFAVTTPFSRQILSRVFGPDFAMFSKLVLPVVIAQLLRASSTGFSILIKADRRVHAIVACRSLSAGLTLVLAPTFAARYGLVPAEWGLTVAAAAGSIALIVCGLVSRDIPLPRLPRAIKKSM